MEDKSIYFRLPKTGKEGFHVEFDRLRHFYDRLHYHPELQLIYIIEGNGDLFVGDTFVHFEPGNLFLIGSNQSHVFKSDPVYFDQREHLVSSSVSIFFHEESLGKGFFSIEETLEICQLIERSGRGIQFGKKISGSFGERIQKLPELTKFERFLEILSLLNDLAASDNYRYLASVNTTDPLSDQENNKVNDVINYILNHYKDDIKLEDVANIASYSQAAFCNFFKQSTRKTFIQFLIEVRISKACKMLRNTDMNVSEVCYECGFNNVSNFNRQFKKLVNLSPTAYVKKYKQSVEMHLV